MGRGSRGGHRHRDMGDDEKKKPLLAKDGTTIKIPEENERGVPVASTWGRDLQKKLVMVALVDVVANFALWFSFFCIVGGRSPPQPSPGPNNNTSNSSAYLVVPAQSAAASQSCLSTLWYQDVTSFSFKTSNIEFVVSSVARSVVLLLLAFSSTWASSERVDRVMESAALWLTGLVFIVLVAKDMLYESSLYSVPVLAVLAFGSLALTAAEYILVFRLHFYAREFDRKRSLKLLTKKAVALGRDAGFGAVHYGGSNDLELGDKVGVDSGTLRADVSEGDDQDDDEEGEHVRRNVSLYEMASIFRPYFWPHSTTNKLIAISTYTVMALSKIAGVMAPAYIGYAGNKVQECYQDPKCGVEGTPYSDILLYTGLTFLASALGQLQSVVYLPVKQNAYIEISESTYRHLMSLSYDWFIKKKQGDVLRCMDRGITSADQVVSYLFLYLFPTIVQCFVVFGIFYTKFVSPELCACAFLSLAIYGIVTVQMTVWRKKFRQKKNKHDDRFHTLANDALTNYETVKYFANEEYEIKRYSEAVREFQTFDVSVRGSLSLLNSSQQLIIQACMCFSLLIASGGILGNGGELKIGDFLAINVYITQLYQPLNFLGTIYGMIIQAIVDLEKLSMLLGERPDVVDGPGAGPMPPPPTNSGMGIEFRNVYFNYPRQNPEQGIKGASFVVPPGTVTALVGPTGCGKTTLGRLLFRFYDPRRGSILVNGKDIRTVKQRSLRSFIGVVPQDTVLFNDTLRHNVNYGRLGAKQHELEEAVAAARLTKFIASLAEGWETVVGERGLRLSGGEKQRVSISRALLKDPPVVLLDEATSALDTVTEKSVQDALSELGKGRTQIVIAHRLTTIMNADQIIVMDQGSIVEKGRHEELLQKKGAYFDLWNVQLRAEEEHAKAAIRQQWTKAAAESKDD